MSWLPPPGRSVRVRVGKRPGAVPREMVHVPVVRFVRIRAASPETPSAVFTTPTHSLFRQASDRTASLAKTLRVSLLSTAQH